MAQYPYIRLRMEFSPVSTVVFYLLFNGFCHGCTKIDTCFQEYKLGVEAAGTVVNQANHSTLPLCAELKAYSNCLRKAFKECHGHLIYHSSTTYIDTYMKRYRCSQYGQLAPPKRPSTPKIKPTCTYSSSVPTSYQYCGLFGDPHLKTFSRHYETCRTLGAWPLIVNKYLAVQVTNLPVVNSSNATAIMKLTVIIKQMGDCASEKTYEATADSPLKPYFNDGSHSAGPDGSVTIHTSEFNGNQKVQIYIRYIDVTLILRKVGGYLAFSCRMPKEVLDMSEQDEFDLCRKGCPSNELLDINTSMGPRSIWENAYANCTGSDKNEDDSKENFLKNTLTDYYLDWCIFDVITSGQHIFVDAAHSAQADTLELDPGSLKNRTVPLWLEKSVIMNKGNSIVQISSVYLLIAFYFITMCY